MGFRINQTLKVRTGCPSGRGDPVQADELVYGWFRHHLPSGMGPVGRLCRPPVDSGPSTPELLAGLCLQQLLPGPFACPGLGLPRRKPSSQPRGVGSQCRSGPSGRGRWHGDVGWRHSAEGSEEGGETSGRRERKGQKSLRKRGHDRPGKETLKSGKVGKRWGDAQPRSGQCGSSSHLFRTGDIFPFCLSKFPSSNS